MYSGLILVSMKLVFVLMGFKIGDLNDHHPMCTWIDFFHYFGDL